jgi:hypothetical protein
MHLFQTPVQTAPASATTPKSVLVIPNEMRDLPVTITDAIFIVVHVQTAPASALTPKSAPVIPNALATGAFFILRNEMKE